MATDSNDQPSIIIKLVWYYVASLLFCITPLQLIPLIGLIWYVKIEANILQQTKHHIIEYISSWSAWTERVTF